MNSPKLDNIRIDEQISLRELLAQVSLFLSDPTPSPTFHSAHTVGVNVRRSTLTVTLDKALEICEETLEMLEALSESNQQDRGDFSEDKAGQGGESPH